MKLSTRIPAARTSRGLADAPGLASRPTCRPRGTGAETPWLRRALLLLCAAALVNLVACSTQSGSMSLQGKPLSGYVRMNEVQAAYLGSGNAGSGTLRYQGRTYPFPVGGLGVGGVGISKIGAKSTAWSA